MQLTWRVSSPTTTPSSVSCSRCSGTPWWRTAGQDTRTTGDSSLSQARHKGVLLNILVDCVVGGEWGVIVILSRVGGDEMRVRQLVNNYDAEFIVSK